MYRKKKQEISVIRKQDDKEMAVKKANEASFKKMDSAYSTAKSAIRRIENHADPFLTKEEQGEENANADPSRFLSDRYKKEWNRLSSIAKQRYIKQAERQLQRQKKRKGIAKAEPNLLQETEEQAAKIFSKKI